MSSMARVAAPILKESAKNLFKKFAKKGVETSIGLASDAIRGKDMNEAIRLRLGNSQQKHPRKRKQGPIKKQVAAKKKKIVRSRKQKDIFS